MANSNKNRYYWAASAGLVILAAAFWSNSAANPGAEDHDHEHEEFIALTKEQREAAGIQTEKAQSGFLQNTTRLHGKIILDSNQVVHVTPKFTGFVKEVYKNDGDDVDENEPLLLLESREIADAKSSYLGALKQEKIALQLLLMEQELKEKNMTSTQDFQTALKDVSTIETEIELARQKLQALGLDEAEIAHMEINGSNDLRFYTVKSPLSGTALNRQATVGEQLSPQDEIFTVANLDRLWVEIFVYPQDISKIKKDAKVHLQSSDGKEGFARIITINPMVNEETRRAKAIASLENSDREWSPGSYVTIKVETDKEQVPLVVRKEAVQMIDGEACVFVEAEDGFEIRPIQTGRCDGKRTEVFSGLTKGEKIAVTNTFLLKADHLKNEAEHEH